MGKQRDGELEQLAVWKSVSSWRIWAQQLESLYERIGGAPQSTLRMRQGIQVEGKCALLKFPLFSLLVLNIYVDRAAWLLTYSKSDGSPSEKRAACLTHQLASKTDGKEVWWVLNLDKRFVQCITIMLYKRPRFEAIEATNTA